jgi:uncharacterized membrane protein
MHLIPASWSHFHLLVSVFPSVGLIFAIGFFVASMVTKKALMQRVCLFVFGGLAVLGIPTYMSGAGAMTALAGRPAIPMGAADAHLYWSYAAFTMLAITGIVALLVLWRSWRLERPSENYLHLILGLSLFTLLLMAIVGELGWEIAHREIFQPFQDGGTSQIWSHIHIILNHFPTVGFVFAFFFFAFGLIKKSDVMTRGGLVVFVMCAVLGASTYVTGTAAMWALTDPLTAGISQVRINQHRDFAIMSLFALAFTGGLSWFEIWRYRYLGRFSKVSLYTVLGFAVITLGLLAETGHLGGQINHPEIRLATDVIPTDPNAFIGPQVELLINTITWFVPWQTVHFFGYTLIFATVLAVTLRILGIWKSLSFAAIHRILPLGVFGVMMNIFSGMLMVMADSHRYLNEFAFWPKMFFLPIGAIAVLYFSLSDRLWAIKAGEDAPMQAKWVAVLVLVSWTIVIMGGRLLPYLFV